MKKFSKKQWIKFSIAAVLYLLFTLWMQNAWLLLGLIVLVDIFLTGYIPWGAWKRTKNPQVRNVLEWVDDILFALVAVYFINIFIFQNYQIPSSSLEKSLLVGDYLFVSKLSYGPRVPNTPVAFPLVQNTLPFFNCKSYLDWPEWDYKRVKGLGHVKRNDIVVFNFPAGDTVALKVQNPDYYHLVEQYGREAILLNKADFGDVIYRPVDKRENYVKRCIGMPGDTIEIRDNQVYIDGVAAKNPEKMQLNYFVETDGSMLSEEQFRLLDVSKADRVLIDGSYNPQYMSMLNIQPNANGQYNPIYHFPLTQKTLEVAKKLPVVKRVVLEPDPVGTDSYYPVDYQTGWSRDNYGPLWIPKKGTTIPLTERNIALYKRCIVNYEHNKLEVKDSKVYINGKPETTYTFKYDYYWMMGDNRHNSADSRSWGFVPEDHIVGKPIMIWLSLDKDRSLFDGGIRWNRMFLGIGFVLAFNGGWLSLTGTGAIMVLALLFWNLPTCYSAATAGLQQIGASVEDAALNLGANSFRSFKDVIIPLLKAPFLSGFVLSFLRSVTCLSVVIFLYAPSTTVGTISVMVLVQSGQWGEAAAFTVVLITIAFTVLRLAQWILGRQGIKLEL